MIDFLRFYFEYPTSKAADNPKTLIKVYIHISRSVKTKQISGRDRIPIRWS